MIRYQAIASTLLVMLAFLTALASAGQANDDVPLITADELKARLEDPDLIILDVRQDKDWASSEFKIRYAIYADPKSYDEWGAAYPKHQPIVLYCA
jgi:rhodanese-related sulfurtransferase